MSESNSPLNKGIFKNILTKVVGFFKDINKDTYVDEQRIMNDYISNDPETNMNLEYDAIEFQGSNESCRVKTSESVESARTINRKKVNPFLRVVSHIINTKYNKQSRDDKLSKSAFRLINSEDNHGFSTKQIISYKDFPTDKNVIRPVPVKGKVIEITGKKRNRIDSDISDIHNKKRKTNDGGSVLVSKNADASMKSVTSSNIDMRSYASKSVADIEKEISEKKRLNQKMIEEISEKMSQHSRYSKDDILAKERKQVVTNYIREKRKANMEDANDTFGRKGKYDLSTTNCSMTIQSVRKENVSDNVNKASASSFMSKANEPTPINNGLFGNKAAEEKPAEIKLFGLKKQEEPVKPVQQDNKSILFEAINKEESKKDLYGTGRIINNSSSTTDNKPHTATTSNNLFGDKLNEPITIDKPKSNFFGNLNDKKEEATTSSFGSMLKQSEAHKNILFGNLNKPENIEKKEEVKTLFGFNAKPAVEIEKKEESKGLFGAFCQSDNSESKPMFGAPLKQVEPEKKEEIKTATFTNLFPSTPTTTDKKEEPKSTLFGLNIKTTSTIETKKEEFGYPLIGIPEQKPILGSGFKITNDNKTTPTNLFANLKFPEGEKKEESKPLFGFGKPQEKQSETINFFGTKSENEKGENKEAQKLNLLGTNTIDKKDEPKLFGQPQTATDKSPSLFPSILNKTEDKKEEPKPTLPALTPISAEAKKEEITFNAQTPDTKPFASASCFNQNNPFVLSVSQKSQPLNLFGSSPASFANAEAPQFNASLNTNLNPFIVTSNSSKTMVGDDMQISPVMSPQFVPKKDNNISIPNLLNTTNTCKEIKQNLFSNISQPMTSNNLFQTDKPSFLASNNNNAMQINGAGIFANTSNIQQPVPQPLFSNNGIASNIFGNTQNAPAQNLFVSGQGVFNQPPFPNSTTTQNTQSSSLFTPNTNKGFSFGKK